MKFCRKCNIFYQEQIMDCQKCKAPIDEVSFENALTLTEKQALKIRIGGKETRQLTDSYKQYHIRCYLKNRSLFLDFDLYKNRLKHGRRLKRFFIAPIHITSLINLPWFLFNIISSNLFHLHYTQYCRRCQTKLIKGKHTYDECDYNIEYFHILDDIITGRIIDRKNFYHQYALERVKQGKKSAFYDLFCRPVRLEIIWDFISVALSVFFWIYIAVYVSWPMFQVLLQKLQQIEHYQWTFLILR